MEKEVVQGLLERKPQGVTLQQLSIVYSSKNRLANLLRNIIPEIHNIEPYATAEKPLKIDLGLTNIEKQ